MDFPDTCVIEPFESKDSFHLVTYGTPVTVRCFYEELSERSQDHSKILISGWLALPVGTAVTEKSRITLPDGSQPLIMSIRLVREIENFGSDYIRVILGTPMFRRDLL
jgi:hypothetical protein